MNEKSCAPTCRAEEWSSIDWNKARAYVKKLQIQSNFSPLRKVHRKVEPSRLL